MTRYFVCWRERAGIDDEYIENFYKNKKYTHLYFRVETATRALKKGFFDDSDYAVIEVKDGKFKRIWQ